MVISLKCISVQAVFTALMSVLKGLADFERLLSLFAVIHLEDHVALEKIFLFLGEQH